MRITCPACSATYEVQDSLLTPGRMVRCTRCGAEWAPPPEPQPPPARELAPVPAELGPVQEVQFDPDEDIEPPPRRPRATAMDRLTRDAPARAGSLALRLAWAASLLVVLGLGAAAYHWRSEVAHAWPPSQRLYHALGLTTADH